LTGPLKKALISFVDVSPNAPVYAEHYTEVISTSNPYVRYSPSIAIIR
jgi:hypothetical protein